MDAELKAKWVDALRSGKYEQCSGSLRVDYGGGHAFCCLGVLADVQGCTWKMGEHPHLNGYDLRQPSGSYLRDGTFGLPIGIQRTLADMNDGGSSFTEIADFIERLALNAGDRTDVSHSQL